MGIRIDDVQLTFIDDRRLRVIVEIDRIYAGFEILPIDDIILFVDERLDGLDFTILLEFLNLTSMHVVYRHSDSDGQNPRSDECLDRFLLEHILVEFDAALEHLRHLFADLIH